MFAVDRRPIRPQEARRLERSVRRNEQSIRAQPRRGVASLAGLSLLCLLVIAVKPFDAVNRWGALVLFGIFAAMCGTICFVETTRLRRENRRLASTIQAGTVVELRIASSRCIEIAEANDEGSDFHFDIGGQGTVFVSDYDLETKRFPNTDFSLVRVYDTSGEIVDSWLTTRGEKLRPFRVIHRNELHDAGEFEELAPTSGSLEDRLRELGVGA